ncbi:MAG: arginine--tRNA ligase [Lachnospiraceae bacterium]|nr:arginine--tRNA ligase [Lachnospiraceae bacterium]
MLTLVQSISEIIKKAFTDAGYDEKFGVVTVSNRPDLCEFQCNGALMAAKQYHKAPIAIAGEVAEKIENGFFEKIDVAAPGFINLKIGAEALLGHVKGMFEDEKFGFEAQGNNRKVIIDYGGANVAKPLHVGHLRPAIIGESVKRILTFDGYDAIGDVHLGDWGLQIGLIITELKRRQPDLPYYDDSFSGEYPKEAPFTISDLEEIYPYASKYSKTDDAYREEAKHATKMLQDGHRGYRAIWQHILDVSINDLKKNYDNLNVHFELWKKESDANVYIPEIIDDFKAKGLARIDEGALVVDVKEDTDQKEMPPCILQKSDGAFLYASTDVATIYERKKLFDPYWIIYVVDKRQELHFDQVFRTCKKGGIVDDSTKLTFLGNGTMNGPDGKPFKTRDGDVLRLEYLINSIVDKVSERMADSDIPESEKRSICDMVGLAAIKYGDLSNQATKDYVFDIDRFTSFDGNTGPYILYTLVRIKSLLSKLSVKDDFDSVSALKCSENITDSEKKLWLAVAGFHEAIRKAADEIAPHKICTYIYEISDLFNSFYHDNRIVTQENVDIKNRWIALLKIVLEVVEKCVDMLGIKVPDRM